MVNKEELVLALKSDQDNLDYESIIEYYSEDAFVLELILQKKFVSDVIKDQVCSILFPKNLEVKYLVNTLNYIPKKQIDNFSIDQIVINQDDTVVGQIQILADLLVSEIPMKITREFLNNYKAELLNDFTEIDSLDLDSIKKKSTDTLSFMKKGVNKTLIHSLIKR
jgi:hypothetical protein